MEEEIHPSLHSQEELEGGPPSFLIYHYNSIYQSLKFLGPELVLPQMPREVNFRLTEKSVLMVEVSG